MRVFHVLDHSIPLHSGYAFRTRSILEQQRAMGWDTRQLTTPKHTAPGPPEEVVDGFTFYRTIPPDGLLARMPIGNYLALMRQVERRLEALVAQWRPDILHAHSPALNGVPALRVGRRLGIPVVYEVRAFWEDAAVDHGTSKEWGLRYRLTRALETYVLRNANAVTTICEGLRNEIITRGIPPGRITVIPNAVDLAQFSVAGSPDRELVRKLGLAGTRVLGFIGSFYAYEGLPLLLQALPAVLRQSPATRVLLVGGGPDEARLRHEAQALGIADKIIFTGRVPHGEVTRYYDLIDVLVYPRYSMRLTELVTPLKPLEAMAQGRLVIASDIGGHRELIRHKETGLLFRAGDADALADVIGQLFQNEASWPQQRQAARRFVETERNWPLSVGRYREVYGQLTSSRK